MTQPIKLRLTETDMLRRFASGPKTLHALTHAVRGAADVQLSPNAMAQLIARLVGHEFLDPPERQEGPYAMNEQGRAYLAGLPAVVPSTLICGASMKEPFTGTVWNIRAGGRDHEQFKSLGMGA